MCILTRTYVSSGLLSLWPISQMQPAQPSHLAHRAPHGHDSSCRGWGSLPPPAVTGLGLHPLPHRWIRAVYLPFLPIKGAGSELYHAPTPFPPTTCGAMLGLSYPCLPLWGWMGSTAPTLDPPRGQIRHCPPGLLGQKIEYHCASLQKFQRQRFL